MIRIRLIAAGIASLVAAAAGAQETAGAPEFDPAPLEFDADPKFPVAEPIEPEGPALSFTVRGGIQVFPEFPGADLYKVGPDLGFGFGAVRFRRFAMGDPDSELGAEPNGLRLRGSFRFLGDRDGEDFEELAGLDDVEESVELGVGLAFNQPNYRVFGDVRYGVLGHNAFVSEVGGDVFVNPTERLRLSAGPRVFFAGDDFADTYFSITPEESELSGLPAFDADGGALMVGGEIGARYLINENTSVEGAVRYDRLIDDADDSPIVTDLGDEDQFAVRFGVTRRINFGF